MTAEEMRLRRNRNTDCESALVHTVGDQLSAVERQMLAERYYSNGSVRASYETLAELFDCKPCLDNRGGTLHEPYTHAYFIRTRAVAHLVNLYRRWIQGTPMPPQTLADLTRWNVLIRDYGRWLETRAA